MPKYAVTVKVINTATYDQTEIEADNIEDAIRMVQEMVESGDVDEDNTDESYDSQATLVE